MHFYVYHRNVYIVEIPITYIFVLIDLSLMTL